MLSVKTGGRGCTRQGVVVGWVEDGQRQRDGEADRYIVKDVDEYVRKRSYVLLLKRYLQIYQTNLLGKSESCKTLIVSRINNVFTRC